MKKRKKIRKIDSYMNIHMYYSIHKKKEVQKSIILSSFNNKNILKYIFIQ